MNKRKLKPFVVPSIYVCAVILFAVSFYLVGTVISKFTLDKNIGEDYVDDSIVEDDNYLPVVATEVLVVKPFLSSTVSISKNYYDYLSEADRQQESILFYD